LPSLSLYIAVIVAIMASFWASLIEATYLTVKPISLYSASRDGSKKAEVALKLTNEKTKVVSVTTFIDTVANVTLASAIGIILSDLFGPIGWLLSVLIGTLLIMVFLILVPKAMGIENSVEMAIWLAPVSSSIISAFSPVAIPLTNLATRLSQLVYGRRNYDPNELVDEFEALIYLMEEGGHIEPNAGRLLRSTFASSNITASDVATSMEKIVSVDRGSRVVDALKVMSFSLHPRLPVHGEAGGYLGAVTFRSLARAISQDRLTDPVVKYMIQPAKVAGGESLAVVAERMSRAGTAIAFVYEQERVVGVITLSDLLERLLGIGIS
jgi:CBS domain containing-hemolysin-like protein